MRTFAIAFLLVFASTAASAASLTDPNLIISPYLTGLSAPTGLRFTGANEGFVIEKRGTVRYFSSGTVTTALDIISNTVSNSERGLLGIALDPNFATNRHVYLHHSTGSGNTDATAIWVDNRVTRYTWDPVSQTLQAPSLVRIFGVNTSGIGNGPNHNGGVLTFGADGKLYGVTGDLNRNSVEQNNRASSTTAFSGGVFRLNTDGTIPAPVAGESNNNKFSGDFALWHAYGVRNSFGLAFDPATGNLWDTENGVDTFDEINLVPSGMNSGWRPIQGPAGATDPNAVLNMLPGAIYQDPKFSFADAIGITSIQFVGSTWGPGYANAVLVGEAVVNSATSFGRLWLFRLNASRDDFILTGDVADRVFDTGDAFAPLGTGWGLTTDIQVIPGDAVYVVSLTQGSIQRIVPVPEPQTWLLALAGLALVAFAVRHKRAATP
jgi:glucose/arabinose dehydrogenase